jgi:pyruvate dehydrogenase E1 component alpha subunit
MITEPHATLRDTDPDVGLFTVLREDGSADPERDPHIAAEVLLSAYRHMRRLRMLDARMIVLQRQGRVGFYGACTGQEAVPIATGLVCKESDWVFPALREQSVMLVRGFPLREFVAQVFGNSGDLLKGRQMPSHQSGKQVHQVSWSSCIGPQIPQAVGAAMAMKAKKSGGVAFGFTGDGATSQPDFHAALTFAGRFTAPAVIVCQNNHWSISVPTARQTASRTIAVKGRSYGVPSVRVDGNDVLATYKATRDARERALRGEGPTFLEFVTYRLAGHSSSDDPKRYRPESECEAFRQKDPIERFKAYLEARGLWDAKKDEALVARARETVNQAIQENERVPRPELISMFSDVYAELPKTLAEALDEERQARGEGRFP